MKFPDIPPIANGTVLPDSVQRKLLEEEKEKNAIKKQHRHDFIVAAFNAVIAGIVSLVVSILYNCLK